MSQGKSICRLEPSSGTSADRNPKPAMDGCSLMETVFNEVLVVFRVTSSVTTSVSGMDLNKAQKQKNPGLNVRYT